jgi:hypothetical protein
LNCGCAGKKAEKIPLPVMACQKALCAVAVLAMIMPSVAFHHAAVPASRPLLRSSNTCGLCRGDGLNLRASAGDEMAGRGDLEDGTNAERNAQIASLKKSFYSAPTSRDERIPEEEQVGTPTATAGEVSLLGVLRDMPLCRWEMTMLPGYNQVLNVWQPMYTHMFETIIAKEEPWYYVHLQTPGGSKNLMNPEFGLDNPDSKTPRVGVLMRVIKAERRQDSRLTCVVQGLSRVRVLEETQKEPYARATVQHLPDDELTRVYYSRAQEILLARVSNEPAGTQVGVRRVEGWVHTVAHAAAVASQVGWQPFESETVSLTDGGVSQLVPYASTQGLDVELGAAVKEKESEVLEDAAELADSASIRDYVSILGAPVLSTPDLVLGGVLGGGLSGARLPAWEGWQEGCASGGSEGGEGEVEGVAGGLVAEVGEMETKLWIEIDLLIRNLRRIRQRSARLQEKGFSRQETGELDAAAADAGMDMAPQVLVLLQDLPALPLGLRGLVSFVYGVRSHQNVPSD